MLHTPDLPQTIYAAVRERILSGVLPAGRPVRQDALAGELGVSKIPVREALARLERDGLLMSTPRKGFEVRPLTGAEAEEIFALRLKLEPAAAALGARAASQADRVAALAAFEALDAQMRRDAARASDLNRAFHLALVRPAGQPLTTQLVERLHSMAERYVRAHLQPQGRPDRARREHAELLQLWTAARAEEVEARLAEHIAATQRDLRAQLSA